MVHHKKHTKKAHYVHVHGYNRPSNYVRPHKRRIK